MKIGTPDNVRFCAGVQLNAPTYRMNDRRFTSETLMAASRRNPPNKMAGRQEDENKRVSTGLQPTVWATSVAVILRS
jgi:hypothetical protein